MKPGIKTATAGIALMALTAATFLPAVAARADDGRFDGRRDDQYNATSFHRQDVRENAREIRDERRDRDDRFARNDRFRRDAPRETVIVTRRDDYQDRDDYRNRDGFRGRVDGFRDDRTTLQETKNNDRNLATLGVAAAAVGVLTHNNTLTAVGAVGAIVGGAAYENARKTQNDNPWRR